MDDGFFFNGLRSRIGCIAVHLLGFIPPSAARSDSRWLAAAGPKNFTFFRALI
jgi:hypothetical protein